MSTVEMLSPVLKLKKKCLGTFLKSTTKQRNQNTSLSKNNNKKQSDKSII